MGASCIHAGECVHGRVDCLPCRSTRILSYVLVWSDGHEGMGPALRELKLMSEYDSSAAVRSPIRARIFDVKLERKTAHCLPAFRTEALIRLAATSGSSCSHTRSTVRFAASNFRLVSASRLRFDSIFSRQNAERRILLGPSRVFRTIIPGAPVHEYRDLCARIFFSGLVFSLQLARIRLRASFDDALGTLSPELMTSSLAHLVRRLGP